MAPYGVVQVGRLALREDSSIDMGLGDLGHELQVKGQESYGRLTMAQLEQRVDDLLALSNRMLPVVFQDKPELTGFYQVGEMEARYEKWMPENVAIIPWSTVLTRVGYAAETDLESRLSGPVTRANDHAATGERWHAPSTGAVAYSAGGSIPTVVSRTGTDGVMTVYRGVGTTANPRWGVTAAGYLLGRCRFLDDLGQERVSTRITIAPTGWEMHNGLVKVSVAAGTGLLTVSAWTGGAWQAKTWEVFHGTGPAVTLGVPTYVSLLRNEFEMVTVRLTKALTLGRVTVDLTLRRGSRFVEVFLQHEFGTTLKIVRSSAEAATSSTGYLTATAADGAGNKYVIGSSRTYTNDLVNGGISKAATPVLDAFIGVQVAAAAAGDVAGDLFKQYLGAPAERVQGVRR